MKLEKRKRKLKDRSFVMEETIDIQQDNIELEDGEEVSEETFVELSNGKGDDEDE